MALQLIMVTLPVVVVAQEELVLDLASRLVAKVALVLLQIF